jgi:hypothetical protein
MWGFQWAKREGWEVCRMGSSMIEDGCGSTSIALGSLLFVFER